MSSNITSNHNIMTRIEIVQTIAEDIKKKIGEVHSPTQATLQIANTTTSRPNYDQVLSYYE